jgi:Ala-tRNA(Pro) deacylase
LNKDFDRVSSPSTHEKLIRFLSHHDIPYREIRHAPEGRIDRASYIRGHAVRQAAKAIVVMVKHSKKTRRYFLGVVPGDRQIDVDIVNEFSGGRRALLAPPDHAETLTGCVMGSVPPISFHEDLHLLVDSSVLDLEEIVFNAARLDLSVAVSSRAFFAAAGGTMLSIAKQADAVSTPALGWEPSDTYETCAVARGEKR